MPAAPPRFDGVEPALSPTATGRADVVPRCLNLLVALVVVASLVVQLVMVFTNGTDANTGDSQVGVPVVTRLVRLFSYFTIQSNLLVLVASVTLVLSPNRDGRAWRVLRLDALLGITVTGLVYWGLLAPTVHLQGAGLLTGLGFHLVAPVLTLVVWLLFGPRPRVSWSTVGWAFVWPVAWIAYTFVHGAVTGWYPYAFLDVTVLGYPRALLSTAIVLLVGVALLLLLRWLDRRLPARPHQAER